MKNLLKKVLCTAIVATQVMTCFTSVKAAEDLLLMDANFENLDNGPVDHIGADQFYNAAYAGGTDTAAVASGRLKMNSRTNVSNSIAEAGYGREGKALFYNMDNISENGTMQYLFMSTPNVYSSDTSGRANIKVTYEISFRAPENPGNALLTYFVGVRPDGGSQRDLISLQSKTNGVKGIYVWDKTDNNSWRKATDFVPGQWYNVAVTLTPGTNKVDYYINGELAYAGIIANAYQYVGGHIYLTQKAEVATGKTYTDNMAIDDFRRFLGTPETADYNTALSSSSYRISGKEIYLAGETPDKATFISKLTLPAGATAEVYKDAKCTTVADTVTEGCTVVVTSKNKRALDYYTTKDREVILEADMESSNGIAENTMFKYTNKLINAQGTGAGNMRFEFPENMTTSVKEAGAGKDGYAFFLEAKNDTAAQVNSGVQAAFIPTISAGKVTFEVSLLAPDSYNTINSALMVPYNGSFKTLIQLYQDGKMGINNQYIEQWVPGRWYNFAVVLTVGSGKADFYLNGKKVIANEDVYVNLKNGIIEYVGGRMKLLAETPAGVSGVTAIDDIKVYTGDYDAAGKSAALVSKSEDYEVSEYGYIFAPEDSVRVNVLNNNLDGSFTVYEDDTFENSPAYTGIGNIIAVTSELGNIVEYYELIPDGNIAPLVNQGATTKLSNRESFGIAAMARYDGAMVYIATYSKDGELLGVSAATADESRSEYTSIGLDHASESYAMLMLWDGETFAPICEPVIIK